MQKFMHHHNKTNGAVATLARGTSDRHTLPRRDGKASETELVSDVIVKLHGRLLFVKTHIGLKNVLS